jgi:GT2 family glycosyltransferase
MTLAASCGVTSPTISVVVITHDEGRNLRSTVRNLQETLRHDSEILVVDDRSSDGSTDFLKSNSFKNGHPDIHMVRCKRRLGVARARNLGAARSRGDYLVFADAHNVFPPRWQNQLIELLANRTVGAVAPAICDLESPKNKGFGLGLTGPDLEVEWLGQRGNRPYPVPFLPGGCLAMRRDTFDAVGGFDEGLIRYGVEDCELSLRLWLLGYELLLVPTVTVAHLFRDAIPHHVYWKTVLHNRLRFAFLHLSARRLARVVRAYQDSYALGPALALVMDSDITARRANLRVRRVHDDNWLFDKFDWSW